MTFWTKQDLLQEILDNSETRRLVIPLQLPEGLIFRIMNYLDYQEEPVVKKPVKSVLAHWMWNLKPEPENEFYRSVSELKSWAIEHDVYNPSVSVLSFWTNVELRNWAIDLDVYNVLYDICGTIPENYHILDVDFTQTLPFQYVLRSI